jgi:NADH-quinone oxidoreductase subunit L
VDKLTILLPALPLLSALAIALCVDRPRRSIARLSVGFAVLTFLAAAASLALYLAEGQPRWLSLGGGWGSLYLDPLASLMALMVAGISLVVHVYAVRYMAEEPGYARFYLLLDLMAAAILVMVAAGDLVALLVAWHLIGVLLYFLLGHDTARPAAQRYAFWSFFTYRLGDLPLVLAAVLL